MNKLHIFKGNQAKDDANLAEDGFIIKPFSYEWENKVNDKMEHLYLLYTNKL